jgi:omega-3 fatty acid desaturase (delta-15 desaturase)
MGIYYFVRDWCFILAMYYFRPFFTQHILLRIVWWNIVGFLGWCLFVVGHDCGHRTFSPSLAVNDLFGYMSHSVLLVPFHGWRISHREHHLFHNNVDKDHSWKPRGKDAYVDFEDAAAKGWVDWVTYNMRFRLLLWLYPLYLLADSVNTSGNHFNPWGRLFADDERVGAAISSGCIIAWLGFLFYTFDFYLLLDAYFVPYLIFVAWLDLVTYLHHTQPEVNYYRDPEWSYLKGGMSTIDRSYGSLIDHLHHDIGTHTVHHLLFTKIPHYHLVEATKHAANVMGSHHIVDETSIWRALWRSMQGCHYVENEGNVVQYKGNAELHADDD